MDLIDLILIFFFLVALGIIGGLIYLAWLPFKRRLIKSGKLTSKLNRNVNWTIVLMVCFIGGILYSHKDDRTTSAERLERNCYVKLPHKFEVLKDDYHDMIQDYCIYYDIQFDKNTSTEFIKSIKTSKFYNAKAFYRGAWKNGFITVDSKRALWAKSPKGYDFMTKGHSIQFDTITNILKYKERG